LLKAHTTEITVNLASSAHVSPHMSMLSQTLRSFVCVTRSIRVRCCNIQSTVSWYAI